MLDATLIFFKTELGSREIGTPGGKLTPKLRRALILVDGSKSVEDLAPLFRPGEIDAILTELHSGGFLSLEGGGANPGLSEEEAQEAPQIDAFEEIRRRAVREVTDRLGPNGDTLALAIERCRTPDQLRAALRDAEKILTSFLGEEYGRGFARRIGSGLN